MSSSDFNDKCIVARHFFENLYRLKLCSNKVFIKNNSSYRVAEEFTVRQDPRQRRIDAWEKQQFSMRRFVYEKTATFQQQRRDHSGL